MTGVTDDVRVVDNDESKVGGGCGWVTLTVVLIQSGSALVAGSVVKELYLYRIKGQILNNSAHFFYR